MEHGKNSSAEPGQPAVTDDLESQRRAARRHAQAGRTDEALACWQRALSLEPGDDEATRQVAALIIAASRERLGLRSPPQLEAARCAANAPLPAPAEGSPAAPKQHSWSLAADNASEIKRTPIQTLEALVREQTANPEPYLELTELYLERGRDYDAERLLARGREATAGDRHILQRWEDVVMMRLEKKAAGAREHAEADDTPQSRAALEQARSERDRIQTEIFTSRCRRDPENAAARHQLGLRLKRAGKLREAIASLREALADPQEKCPAALAIGECHEQLHEVPEALQHYRLAAESALLPAQVESHQLALYDAARLVAGMNLPRLAQRYLGELLKLQPGHEEAQQLLNRLSGGK